MFLIFAAAITVVAFSFVLDASMTHCSAVPFLKVTGWCGSGPKTAE
jgi:hypothetical protein